MKQQGTLVCSIGAETARDSASKTTRRGYMDAYMGGEAGGLQVDGVPVLELVKDQSGQCNETFFDN